MIQSHPMLCLPMPGSLMNAPIHERVKIWCLRWVDLPPGATTDRTTPVHHQLPSSSYRQVIEATTTTICYTQMCSSTYKAQRNNYEKCHKCISSYFHIHMFNSYYYEFYLNKRYPSSGNNFLCQEIICCYIIQFL